MSAFLLGFLAGAAAIGVPTALLNLRRQREERKALTGRVPLWVQGELWVLRKYREGRPPREPAVIYLFPPRGQGGDGGSGPRAA